MTVSTRPADAPSVACEIIRGCAEHDQPDIPAFGLDAYRAALAHPWPGLGVERYFGCLDGEPVGHLQLTLPQLDNLDKVSIDLAVLPAARRRGVGRALFELALARAEALGRKYVTGMSVDVRPDGAAFARSVGAAPALDQVRSRLDLRTVDQPRLDALLADAWRHAEGYRLILWTGVPPDEVIADVAYLEGRFNLDAPVGDLVVEQQQVDTERMRATEQCRVDRGQLTYQAGALHGERLVAYTALNGHPSHPAHVWQSTTLVAGEHRGHRLGLLVKLANLAHLRELAPGIETIDTYNARSNAHMVRINEAMGFRAVDAATHWQLSR